MLILIYRMRLHWCCTIIGTAEDRRMDWLRHGVDELARISTACSDYLVGLKILAVSISKIHTPRSLLRGVCIHMGL